MSYPNPGQNGGQGGRYGQFNPYAQQNDQYEPQGRYGQPAGYASQPNPYDQRQQGGYGQQQSGYGQQQPAYGQSGGHAQAQGRYDPPQGAAAARPEAEAEESNNYGQHQRNDAYEMGTLNGQSASGEGPHAIRNACANINSGIQALDLRLSTLEEYHKLEANEMTSDSEIRTAIDTLTDGILTTHRELAGQLRRIVLDPASKSARNAPHVQVTTKDLKAKLTRLENIKLSQRNLLIAQQERDIRIANPELTDEEVKEQARNPDAGPIYANNVMESGRRGAATKAKSAAQKRSDGVEQIVKDLIALNKVFEELANLVEQQEAAVQNIDQRGEEVQTNVEQANVELTGATEKASSARRKKFWCLGIAILIVIIIAVIVVVVVLVLRRNNGSSAPAPAPAPQATTASSVRMLAARELAPDRS